MIFEIKNNFERYEGIESVLKFGKRSAERVDITITIPTFNREEELDRALSSIFSQRSRLRYEVLIVDNDFFDLKDTNKLQILNKYKDFNLAYYQNVHNIGLFGNWNRCIELSNSQWVAMLHDDDCLSDDYFDEVYSFWDYLYNSKDVAYVKTRCLPFGYRKGRKRHGLEEISKANIEILAPNNIGKFAKPSCGTLLNKELMIRCGGYDEDRYPAEDGYMIIKLMICMGYRVLRTKSVLGCFYEDDSVSCKEKTLIAYADEYNEAMKEYPNWGRLAGILHKLFANDMYYMEKSVLNSIVDNNAIIINKEEAKAKINKILGCPQKRQFRIIILKSIKYFNNFLLYMKSDIRKDGLIIGG